jgi:glycerate kinase
VFRVVVAPDSFKGSLTAPEVCAALMKGLKRASPDIDVVARPMADGGEGTLDAVLAAVGASGRRHQCAVQGAGGATIDAAYGMLASPGGPTASPMQRACARQWARARRAGWAN